MGKKFGKIAGVKGTRIDILKNQANLIGRFGLIPIINEPGYEGVVMSDITRCADAEEVDYKAISLVKVYNWIKKTLLHYLNESTDVIFRERDKKSFA